MEQPQRAQARSNKGPIKKFRDIPKRFFLFLALLIAAGSYYANYFQSMEINESQYFWILGSFVQGFSAFTGIVIASLTLATQKIFARKINAAESEKMFLMPISMSIITVLFSIIGMVFYGLFASSRILGHIIAITSIIAIWCIFEVFYLITNFITREK